MEKSAFDKKKMGDLYDELFSTLGQQNKSGQGMFHKKFIQVCSLLCARFFHLTKVLCNAEICFVLFLIQAKILLWNSVLPHYFPHFFAKNYSYNFYFCTNPTK